ncbi:hypothetical protein GCM10027048_41640 [Hymenobacter coalescens]
MNSTILTFACSALTLAAVVSAQAQTIYTSRAAGGDWSASSTWDVSGDPSPNPVPTNRTGQNGLEASNNVIIITSPVVLDVDYSVSGDNGKLTIQAGGSLTDGTSPNNLSFGELQGADVVRLDLDGTLDVYSLSFLKADADVSATAELSTNCNLTLENQSDLTIAQGGTVAIDGNLVLRQGNPTISGTGLLSISGCVLTTNNGSLNGLFGPNLRVCVQGQANSCATEGLSCNTRVQEAIAIDACRTAPLPVELISFTARLLGKQVQLNWATALEKDADSFVVERSANGKEFEAVTTLRAAGNSTTRREYSYLDPAVRPGLTYYRLKQIDRDGTFTHSQVVTVQSGEVAQQLEAYGTLAGLTVEMRTSGAARAFRVMDSMGRVVHSEMLPEGATGLVTRQIPLRQRTSGVYIVQAITTDGTVSKKLFLQQE